ncbi:MAG: hypothetical protein CEN90_86 [Parcubacteria group bacterium Licking1014_17]|nr:MAG: hypothetical protein CEN90_86 [Parcubacteria group bacterium Licking1014_17]
MFTRKNIIIAVVVISIALGVLIRNAAKSRSWAINEINVKNSNASAQNTSVFGKPKINLPAKIAEGVELLKKSAPIEVEKGLKKGKSVDRRQIALAILDTNTGAVFEKRYWLNKNELEMYGDSGMVKLEPIDPKNDLIIEVKYWNGYNSFLDVSNKDGMIVVANKYTLSKTSLGSLIDDKTNDRQDIVYVPYSESLQTKEMIKAGKRYLTNTVERAMDDLEQRKVVSKAEPDKLVTKVFDKNFIKSIALVEHIDPSEFYLADDGGKELVERVLTIIGANKNLAYKYSGSPAGAYGMAQFIEPTYDAIANAYPEAGLIKDFRQGMADHVNAIKAMYLYFDIHKKEIDVQIAEKGLTDKKGIEEEMLAATYNGGPGNVLESVRQFGFSWISKQSELSPSKSIMKDETLTYVKKFRAVRSLSVF